MAEDAMRTVIEKGTEFDGTIKSERPIVLSGSVKGQVTALPRRPSARRPPGVGCRSFRSDGRRDPWPPSRSASTATSPPSTPAASKSGILGITRSMANELAPLGINVNAIAPGWIVTDITANVRQDPVRSQSTMDRISANRWGEPADVKGVVVFLASRASDYMHGSVVPIDGGWLAK